MQLSILTILTKPHQLLQKLDCLRLRAQIRPNIQLRQEYSALPTSNQNSQSLKFALKPVTMQTHAPEPHAWVPGGALLHTLRQRTM